ncbi:FMR1-interacting protein NUFIP2 isoform X1 [Stigmatopora nigra]
MEAQPKDRARQNRNQHRGDDASPPRWIAGLKHEQNHFHQRQHQETNAKKTGNKKVSLEEEVEKSRHLFSTAGMPHPPNGNGNRYPSTTNLKKSTTRPYSAASKASGKGLDSKKTMDPKNGKAADFNYQEDEQDAALLQNGIAHGDVINGYSCKDNDGSGSEGGYTVAKKQKARCNMDDDDKEQEPPPALDIDEAAEKAGTSPLDCFKATHKVETQSPPRRTEATPLEPPRKNSEGKAVGKKMEERHRAKVCSKEDSWTLFKPPPVFPVDNSSAKIVPKISYASKVKENLNKVAQGGAEVVPPPIRLSQVPMSAMKTITSASFSNGPVSASGNGTFFSLAATGSVDDVASPLESICDSNSTGSPLKADPYELRKCSLLIYPLNMQAALPSARHLNPPAAQTNQKALGEIFQNKWGLSFINEPNLAPAEDDVAPGQRRLEGPFFPETAALARDAEKRTFLISPTEEENGEKTSVESPAQIRADAVLFGASKEQVSLRDVCGRRSRGAFDVKAAVAYHTKEMEYVFSLQKQYPNLVLVYDGAKDGPDQ